MTTRKIGPTLKISWSNEVAEDLFGIILLNTTEQVLQFDAVLEETHESMSELTQHAVETAVADHKIVKPRKFSLSALVTNTPLQEYLPTGPNFDQVTARIDQTQFGIVNTFSQEFNRISEVWGILEALQKSPTSLVVSTKYRYYDNMQLVSVGAPRKTSEDAVAFDLKFEELYIASAQVVDVVPREPRAKKKKLSARAAKDKEIKQEGFIERSRALGIL